MQNNQRVFYVISYANIVSWEKETKVIHFRCWRNMKCRDFLNVLSGLSNGYEFKSFHFWNYADHTSLSHDADFTDPELSHLNGLKVINLYSEIDSGLRGYREYAPIWGKGMVDHPRRECFLIPRLCDNCVYVTLSSLVDL